MEFNKFNSKKEKKERWKQKQKNWWGGVGGLGTFPIAFEMLLNKAL